MAAIKHNATMKSAVKTNLTKKANATVAKKAGHNIHLGNNQTGNLTHNTSLAAKNKTINSNMSKKGNSAKNVSGNATSLA